MYQSKEIFLSSLGNRVRQLRTQKQMSLDELARKSGYTSENARSSIQKIEAGKSDIPISKIKLIANALEVSPCTLMGWDEDKSTEKENPDSEVDRAVQLFVQLDSLDRSKVIERMETLLEDEKYFPKEGLQNA